MPVASSGNFVFERLEVAKGESSMAQVAVGAFHCVASTMEVRRGHPIVVKRSKC
jgi:hypothetical protein